MTSANSLEDLPPRSGGDMSPVGEIMGGATLVKDREVRASLVRRP